jgi:hypothetical protein
MLPIFGRQSTNNFNKENSHFQIGWCDTGTAIRK